MKKILSLLTFFVMFLATTFAATTDPLSFTATQGTAKVAFNIHGTLSTIPSLQYSLDGGSWKDYTFGDEIILQSAGSSVSFRATDINQYFSENAGYIYFVASNKVEANGNIMSLLDKSCKCSTVPDYCFRYLFGDCEYLTKAPQLPATKVKASGYGHMFSNCTRLIQAPELPAMEIGVTCYYGMFRGCTNLKTVSSKLPATTLAHGCYCDMFMCCSSLVNAPELPAMTLSNNCYKDMFYGCTSLKTAPKLPAKTLTENCYNAMFIGCVELVTPPELPATSLAPYCYQSMFRECAKLKNAPELPATTMKESCYQEMFRECSSITVAPKLPATNLAEDCYNSMFLGCENLVTPPELPATNLAKNCYYNMFCKCSSLETAPELPAEVTEEGCYAYMFYKCSKLKTVTVRFKTWNKANTESWLEGVSSSGTFICLDKLEDWYGDSYIPSKWTVKKGYIMPKNCFRIVAYEDDTKVWFSKSGTLTSVPSLIYSTDEGETWNECTFGTQITLEDAGNVIYFMAEDMNGSFSQSAQNRISFGSTRTVYAKGNIMSLLDNSCTQTTVPNDAFNGLFYGASLITAPELPALTVGDFAYSEMFRNSTLLYAPELPATKVGDNSYQNMFEHCTKMTKVPKELPAKKVEWYSYYSMFKDCELITESPFIAAETLDYTEACRQMFQGCTQLSKVNVAFTKWDDSTENWLDGVSATGTFTCPATLDITTRGVDTVPTGWNIVQTGEANPTIVDLAKLINSILKGGTSTINDVNTLKNKILKK